MHDDETEIGHRRVSISAAERLGHERALRPGVDRFEDGILLLGIEVARSADDAPDIRLAVAAFGDEDLERMVVVALHQLRGIGLFQRADQLAVVGATQLVLGRRIDAAVRVDQVLAIGRELHRVVAVAFGERDQTRAVEVHAVVMHEVRILIGILAAGVKPDLSFLLVDLVDAADNILARGDLILDAAVFDVEQVQVPPAVAFRGVNRLVAFRQPVDALQVDVLGMGRPDERLRFFVEDIEAFAGMRIDVDDPQPLVAAIDLFVGQVPAVAIPSDTWKVEVNLFDVRLDPLLGVDIEDTQFVGREFVTGKVVWSAAQVRTAAAGRR